MRLTYPNTAGDTLVADVSVGSGKSKICVVVCHGFTAHRGRHFLPSFHAFFEHAGYSVCSFDFSGNGESDGLFWKSTFPMQCQDLSSTLDALEKQYGFTQFILVGHSMGGAVASYVAATDARIVACISVSSPVVVRHVAWHLFGQRLGVGMLRALDSKDRITYLATKLPKALHQMWRMPRSAEWFFAWDELRPQDTFSCITCPYLSVFGTADRLVPPTEQTLWKEYIPHAELHTVEGANHDYKRLEWRSALFGAVCAFLCTHPSLLP